jgi:hypothetical protein
MGKLWGENAFLWRLSYVRYSVTFVLRAHRSRWQSADLNDQGAPKTMGIALHYKGIVFAEWLEWLNLTIIWIHLAPKPYSNNVVLWNALLWLSGRAAGKISSKLFVDGLGLDLRVKTDGQIC